MPLEPANPEPKSSQTPEAKVAASATARSPDPEADAALRDAARIAERIERDEVAADEARRAYRLGGLPSHEPDDEFRPQLRAAELLHAVHELAIVGQGQPGMENAIPRGGTLAVTSQRLLLCGARAVAWGLDEIREMSVAPDRLLLHLRDGSMVGIEVDQPRLLRVQLAAAIAAIRAAGPRGAAEP